MALEIAILPFTGVRRAVLEELCEDLRACALRCALVPEQPLPPDAYNPWRRQYNADLLLARTRELLLDSERVLGVTDADLYAADLNFVFGMADVYGQAAVVSVHRLQSEDRMRARERVLKEALHELGHTFGLAHCADPRCVMYFSNTLADTDRKTAAFCPVCAAEAQLRAPPAP